MWFESLSVPQNVILRLVVSCIFKYLYGDYPHKIKVPKNPRWNLYNRFKFDYWSISEKYYINIGAHFKCQLVCLSMPCWTTKTHSKRRSLLGTAGFCGLHLVPQVDRFNPCGWRVGRFWVFFCLYVLFFVESAICVCCIICLLLLVWMSKVKLQSH